MKHRTTLVVAGIRTCLCIQFAQIVVTVCYGKCIGPPHYLHNHSTNHKRGNTSRLMENLKD